MSTQKSKLSSSDDDAHPASGQRPALRYRSEPSFPENEGEGAGFSATCENTSLSDWIQLVQMNRRDAVIGIKRNDGKKALLWCRDGDIIDAWCDGVIGEDAVYRALTWEGGQVSVAFAPFEHERQIEIATPALLLRAAYRKDSGVRELRPEVRTPSSPAPACRPCALNRTGCSASQARAWRHWASAMPHRPWPAATSSTFWARSWNTWTGRVAVPGSWG